MIITLPLTFVENFQMYFYFWPLPRILDTTSLPNIASWSFHWRLKHHTSKTEFTTLSFPKLWLTRFSCWLMPLTSTSSFRPEVWQLCSVLRPPRPSAGIQSLLVFSPPHIYIFSDTPSFFLDQWLNSGSPSSLCRRRCRLLLCAVTVFRCAHIPSPEPCKHSRSVLTLGWPIQKAKGARSPSGLYLLVSPLMVKARRLSRTAGTLVWTSDFTVYTLLVLHYT